jgi:hypothetical protein
MALSSPYCTTAYNAAVSATVCPPPPHTHTYTHVRRPRHQVCLMYRQSHREGHSGGPYVQTMLHALMHSLPTHLGPPPSGYSLFSLSLFVSASVCGCICVWVSGYAPACGLPATAGVRATEIRTIRCVSTTARPNLGYVVIARPSVVVSLRTLPNTHLSVCACTHLPPRVPNSIHKRSTASYSGPSHSHTHTNKHTYTHTHIYIAQRLSWRYPSLLCACASPHSHTHTHTLSLPLSLTHILCL